MHFYTNLSLSNGRIDYPSTAAMEEGSPVAQALAMIDGIAHLTISVDEIIVARQPDAEWYAIVEDISAALKDFFL